MKFNTINTIFNFIKKSIINNNYFSRKNTKVEKESIIDINFISKKQIEDNEAISDINFKSKIQFKETKNTLDLIKHNFQFLVNEYNFKIVNEENKLIYLSRGLFDIVRYKNDFSLIEIGADSTENTLIEIRKYRNSQLVNYGDTIFNLNLNTLISLVHNDDDSKNTSTSISILSKIIEDNIVYFTSDKWFNEEEIKLIKNKFYWKNKILEEVDLQNKELLLSKGYKFHQSNNTIPSFDVDEFGGPFYIYKNSLNELKIEYVSDIKDQYFCYHIEFNNKLVKGLFYSNNIVELISDEIEKLI